MSCVAEAKATIQNNISVSVNGVMVSIGAYPGRVAAIMMKHTAIMDCIAVTHHRLLRMMSTNGLHRGLITHGRYSILVYSAIRPFGSPILLNIITDMLLTI